MTATTTGTTTAGITVQELELAWRAVQAGQFRPQPQTVLGDWTGTSAKATVIGAPVVVVGAHGWSGTSTTALLIADAAARRGAPARVVDVAESARSGFAAAAATEHGVDQSGQWRQGSRPSVTVQRLAHPAGRPRNVPAPPAGQDDTVTVIDTGWPVADLLQLLDDDPGGRHWLAAVLGSAPLVLTARATIPGLRHAEATLQALTPIRIPGARLVLALLGPSTLPRPLTASAGPAVLAAHRDHLLVTIPDRPDLTRVGLTPAPLPRQLHPAGERLLALTHPAEPRHPPPHTRPRTRRIPPLTTFRKDQAR